MAVVDDMTIVVVEADICVVKVETGSDVVSTDEAMIVDVEGGGVVVDVVVNVDDGNVVVVVTVEAGSVEVEIETSVEVIVTDVVTQLLGRAD